MDTSGRRDYQVRCLAAVQRWLIALDRTIERALSVIDDEQNAGYGRLRRLPVRTF